MTTVEFLKRVLPSRGVYFVATLKEGGYWNHEPYTTVEDLAARFAQLAPHMNTYFPMASFRSPFIVETARNADGSTYEKKRYRTHANAMLVKSFWIDVDVDPENPEKYASQADAITLGLAPFLKETGLPHPLVVSSGFGLHLYWTLTEDVLPDNWQPVADALRALAAEIGFKIDAQCTADRSRVLRPVGTFNHKRAPTLVPVTLTDIQGAPVDFDKFRKLVETAAKAFGIDTNKVSLTKKLQEEVNAGAGVKMSGPPSSATKVADKCAQLGHIRDTLGNVPEPLWYAGLQLLHFTAEGDSVAHAWSQGHPEYDATATQNKIVQIVNAGVKPTTCAHFEKVNPAICRGCPHRGNIHSPIALGKQFDEAPPAVIEVIEVAPGAVEPVEVPAPPHPFRRVMNAEMGHVQIVATIESVERVIYPYDFYPVELTRDEDAGESNGYSVKLRHWQPHDGWQEFMLDTRLFAKPSDLLMKIMQHGMIPPAGYDTWVVTMIRAWAQDIQSRKASHKLSTKLGWVEDPDGFQVGDRLYTKEGKRRAGISKAYRELAKDFGVKGTLEEWKKLTAFFGRPGVEGQAFAFCSAFGSPLLKLTGYNGAVINLQGKTGEGKSLTGAIMQSVWREAKKGGKVEDSYNYYTAALTFYSNLPYYLDEITNMDPEVLDGVVYSITQGEGKGRMRADTSIREKGEWQTLLVTSSNSSMRQRLASVRNTTAATQMRMLEFKVTTPEFIAEWGEAARVLLPDNYGVAGDAYAAILAQLDQADLRKQLLEMEQFLTGYLECTTAERFWVGAATANIAGALLAYAFGIIAFNPVKLLPWLKAEMQKARGTVETAQASGSEAFSSFINDHAGERIVVQRVREGDEAPAHAGTSNYHPITHAIIRQPNGRICIHQDVTSCEMWVRRATLSAWCEKNRVDMDGMIQDLQSRGLVKGKRHRVTLGKGTNMGTTVRDWCLILDTSKLELDGLDA